MKILNEKPPIYDAIIQNGMQPHAGVIYTYKDTIYNPSGADIPDHLIVHEETHSRQQGDNPDNWWGRYLTDQYFRIEQESEAYARQFAFICNKVKDRNQRNRILLDLALVLSGPIYGNVISQQNAMKIIKSKSNVK